MPFFLRFVLVPASLLMASSAHAAGVPGDCEQLIVGLAPSWNSMRGELQRFERSGGGPWRHVGGQSPVLFGKNGLAWGRGLAGQEENGLRKKERDGRAPAGVFQIGRIYTYDPALPAGADFPFHQVTKADAWIDDPTRPDYNRFVTIDDPKHPPPWFAKEKMRHNDFAYRWLVEVRHNSDPPLPNEGSAIFFHIRRGSARPTSGCTTMAESDLVHLITWLRSAHHPCYVLLPRAVYGEKAETWGLPALGLFGPGEKFKIPATCICITERLTLRSTR
jgi:L,D-peptidoglycan transpeptidase YkuD (ErfK/YbiS/YcfS/YnhG family)